MTRTDDSDPRRYRRGEGPTDDDDALLSLPPLEWRPALLRLPQPVPVPRLHFPARALAMMRVGKCGIVRAVNVFFGVYRAGCQIGDQFRATHTDTCIAELYTSPSDTIAEERSELIFFNRIGLSAFHRVKTVTHQHRGGSVQYIRSSVNE